MIFNQYCIPRPKLSEKLIRGLQNAYFFNFKWSKLGFLTETVKKWLESSQNHSIAQNGLFFFLLFDPWIRFIYQFWYRKVFLLYWLCLSKRYLAKNTMWYTWLVYLYCGLLRNDSLLFMHPPALSRGATRQCPTTWTSLHVLEKENKEVLIIRQIDSSVNWYCLLYTSDAADE